MPERLHPGVYIQEVASGSRPIEGASTSTAAFIGKAEMGTVNKAVLVTSVPEFEAKYGTYVPDSFLSHAVHQFYNNGGKKCYIVRVAGTGAKAAAISIKDRRAAPVKGLTIAASSEGDWGNRLDIEIRNGTNDPNNEFAINVLKDRSQQNPPLPPLLLETHDNLSMDPNANNFVEKQVGGNSNYIVAIADKPDRDNTVGQLGTSRGGRLAVPVTLAAGDHKFVIFVNGDGPHEVTLTAPVGGLTDGAIATPLRDAVRALTPKRSPNAAAFTGFLASFETSADPLNPSFLLTSGAPGINSSVRVLDSADPTNVAATLKLGVTNGGAEVLGHAVLRPANSAFPTEYHLGDAVEAGNVDKVELGLDGSLPGNVEHIKGLEALDVIRDVNILCIPGISAKPVVDAGTNYCARRMDCFFIADPNLTDDSVEDAKKFLESLTVKSSYGALYYPWLTAIDPSGAPDPIKVPPSGFVAGMYARIDSKRGVWKAPAGTEANVGGALGLVADTTDDQQDFLNPIGVNVIRSFPASGLVVWGARTLATRSDPEYRYVPVRRTAIFLEQSIYAGIQWAVFEPNDEPLWASLRLNINAFMMLQFRAGAFQGKTASDAFFVQCDDKTTTQADIDAGVVNIRVGFAPLKPAEFVVLMLSQKVNQPAA
jgi:phage tail sheath protein FI